MDTKDANHNEEVSRISTMEIHKDTQSLNWSDNRYDFYKYFRKDGNS